MPTGVALLSTCRSAAVAAAIAVLASSCASLALPAWEYSVAARRAPLRLEAVVVE